MLRNTLRFSFALVALVALVALAACGKDQGKSDKSGATKKTDKPATKTFTLAQVDNLKVELPAAANISEGPGQGVMIVAPDLVLSISRADSATAKTLADAKKVAQRYKPQKLQAEKLSDGYALSYENQGHLGRKHYVNYFVHVVRVIGGKAYSCDTTANRPAQKANALKACKGLHK